MGVITNPADYLFSAQTASAAGAALDTRNAKNYAYIVYATQGASAIFRLQASHDSTGWMTVATYTGTTSSGSAQVAGYFPYVRADVHAVYSGGGATGALSVFYAPGVG